MNKEDLNFSNKYRYIIPAVLLSITTILLNVQTYGQTTLFQRTIGGSGSDAGGYILRTSEGGYFISGMTYSYSAGENDFYLLKLDTAENLQWSKRIGGASYDYNANTSQTSDMGYIVVGTTESFGIFPRDIFLVKLNSAGTVQWSRTIGTANNLEEGAMVIQTSDGGYAITGSQWKSGTFYDIYIVKLDSTGTFQWSSVTAGPTNSDRGTGIIQTPDGGYAVCGTYGDDMVLLRLSAGGTLLWSKTIGGTGVDNCTRIIRTSGGDYILAGRTNSFGAGGFDSYIARLDSSGTIKWTRTIGGTGTDEGSSIIQTQDGGFALFGITNSFGNGNFDTYLIKLDSAGVLLWSRTAGSTGEELGRDIVRNTNGEFFTVGQTASYGSGNQVYLVKFDAAGNSCGNTNSPVSISGSGGTSTNQTVTLTPVASTVNSQTPATGSGGTFSTVCIITGIQPDKNELPQEYSLLQNYPNPFNPSTKMSFALPKAGKVKLVIFDILGREVATLVNEQLNAGTYSVDFDGSMLSSGVYFYKLIVSDASAPLSTSFTESRKMLLVK